jgi:hypothetical protein
MNPQNSQIESLFESSEQRKTRTFDLQNWSMNGNFANNLPGDILLENIRLPYTGNLSVIATVFVHQTKCYRVTSVVRPSSY